MDVLQSKLPQFLSSKPQSGSTVLILAPHPDDECLMGVLALRMREETGCEVWVAAYGLGSNLSRQSERSLELHRACNRLGFQRLPGVVNEVSRLVEIFTSHQVGLLIVPHAQDGHATHQGSHALARAALDQYKTKTSVGATQKITLALTEYWSSMPTPNLLLPISRDHVVQMGEALSEHVGEISRNPYHLRLPAFYQEQVRRGSEQVRTSGSEALPTLYGQLYRLEL